MKGRPPTFYERAVNKAAFALLAVALIATLAFALGEFHARNSLLLTKAAIGCMLAAFLLREFLSHRSTQRLARDLTRQVREVEEKNRLLNLTEATAHVGHWRIDLATDTIFWSDETFAIHGLEPGTPPSLEKAIEYFHPDDRGIVDDAVEGSRASGEPYLFRARLVRADGSIRHTESTALVEFDEDGQPSALFGVFHDRTQEEEMQRELREARDEARALADAKSAFLAKMSHEIRTPMNGVLGFAELLSASPLNPEQRRQIDLMLASGKALQTLLNDILDLSKIEAGHVEIRSSCVDLHDLVRQSTQMVEPLARERHLRIGYEIAPDVPRHVVIDGLRVRQVLGNLLVNAIRFTDRGGVMVKVKADEGLLALSVIDTGVGISQHMQTAIFSAFTQDNELPQRNRGGSGLGLAISRQLTELMDGTLTVRSEAGQGSAFTMALPLMIAQQPGHYYPAPAAAVANAPQLHAVSAVAQARTDPMPPRPVRVLLAEDYDINRELITQMARRIGIELEHAEDGEEAVRMVLDALQSEQPYDLVLMDLQMPRLDGIEATKRLRNAAGLDAVALPIIALTANAFADDVEACLAAGMQEHLAKPISMEIFRDALSRWLPTGSLSPPTPPFATDHTQRGWAASG